MNKVRVGLLGLGGFGQLHASAWSGLPHAELVAIADLQPERVHMVGDRFGVPRRFTDYRALLREPDLDVLVVATGENFHAEPVLAAIAAGKHVLCEKPLALTAAEGEQMVAAARSAGVELTVGHVLRFDHRFVRIHERVARGDLGRVVSFYSRRNSAHRAWPVYRRVWPCVVASVHDIDLALWYIADRPVEVYARKLHLWGEPNPDGVWAMISFAGGAVAVVEANYYMPDGAPQGVNAHTLVLGERGAAQVDNFQQPATFWGDSTEQEDAVFWPDLYGHVSGALKEEVSYFASCILEGRSPERVPAPEVLQGLRVLEAVIESASTGKVVRLV